MVEGSGDRYEVLDGMRGVAAICVMIFHYGQATSYTVFHCAGLAVDLFFMLSGFVIAHAYSEKLRNGMHFSEYVTKRMVRLYPMLLFGVVLGAIILLEMTVHGQTNYSKTELLGSVVYNSLFLPFINDRTIHKFGISFNYIGEIFPTNPPAWSLFFELLASSAFVLLTRLKQSTLINATILCYAAFICLGTINSLLDYRYAFNFVQGWNSQSFIGGFPRVFFGFSLGIVIYRAVVRNEFGPLTKLKSAIDGLIGHPFILFALVVAVLAVPTEMDGFYPALMLVTAIPLFLVIGAKIHCDGLWQRRICLFLGWLSYPIYCLHYPIGRAVFLVSNDAGYSLSIALISSVICTVLSAAVVAKIYDGPVRAWLTAKLSSSRRVFAS